MTRLYEGMFLLDNQVVREDWKKAKELVAEALTKHGAKIRSLRRWDERKLAYPIKKRNRATFFLTFFDMEIDQLTALRRDLELSEKVLRHMLLRCEELPEKELELAALEQSADFVVPSPPPDDAPEPVVERRRDDRDDTENIFVPDLENLQEE